MPSRRAFRLRLALLSVVVLATAAPISFSRGGLRARTAECQGATCCFEMKSMCVKGKFDQYLSSDGKCTEILPNVPG